MAYPVIYLDEYNDEIANCTVLKAFVGLFANIELNDGVVWTYADVMSYENGVMTFQVDSDGMNLELSYPIVDIATITYI